jgi:hypothetical protein
VGRLRAVFTDLDAVPARPPGRAARAVAAVRDAAARFAAWPRFAAVVSWLFAIWAILSVLGVFELVFSLGIELGTAHRGFRSDSLADLKFVNIASLASTTLSALLVARGIVALRRGHRESAYRSFEQALVVAIFVTQVFSFVESQFGAVFGLAVDVVLLLAVRALRQPTAAAGSGETSLSRSLRGSKSGSAATVTPQRSPSA